MSGARYIILQNAAMVLPVVRWFGGWKNLWVEMNKQKNVIFRDFYQDLGALVRFLGQDVYACVGHSAGGLCMMAARKQEHLEAKKYVCISAPQKPYPPLNLIRRKLRVPYSLIERYRGILAGQFNCCWEEITECVYWRGPDSQLLLLYDMTDSVVSHSDGDEIKAGWPSATLVKTHGISHSQQIRSTEILNKVIDFLAGHKTQL